MWPGISEAKLPLELSDVSILFPMPHSNSELLGPDDEGVYGILLPKEAFQYLPPFESGDSEIYQKLRVVGIRLDPCPARREISLPCYPEIRLIWQPLVIANDKISSLDDTVHTFYDLSREEIKEILSTISEYKNLSGETFRGFPFLSRYGNPAGIGLGVHPIIQQEGPGGPFAKKLKVEVLNFAGEKRLKKMTFMRSLGTGIWDFGGFDFNSTGVKAIDIPNINSTRQFFYNSSKKMTEFLDGGPSPAPLSVDTIQILISDSDKLGTEVTDEIRNAVVATWKIENPRITNAHNTDCVSCHTAQPARFWFLGHFSVLQSEYDFFAFKSKYNLINGSELAEKTTRLRAFGYDGNVPVINQRTINDSARVLEDLEAF